MSSIRTVPSKRTNRIIGRTPVLDAIYEALADQQHTRLLYFYGPGGIGKTRVLEEIVSQAGEWRGAAFRSTEILDLYDSEFQSGNGIRQGIVAGIGQDETDFQDYREKLAELERIQEEGASLHELRRLQEELDAAFSENYEALARHNRIVICLDTLELMQHESDFLESLCQVESLDTVVMNWIAEELPKLPATVALLAGRPENKATVEALFHTLPPTVRFNSIPLNEFSADETQAYLEAKAADQKQAGDPSLAEILRRNPHLASNIHRAARGRPVYLALIIDLFLNHAGSEFINEILSGREFKEEELAKELIDNLRALPDPYGRIINFMFFARKGLDGKLLSYLSDWSMEQAEEFLRNIGQLAIVKTRTIGHGSQRVPTVFFHDEVYNMYDMYFKEIPGRAVNYEPFVSYYRREMETAHGLTLRETLAVNRLFYELRLDPYEGYYRYYANWDHEAIKGHESDYDMRLRNEVLSFLNRYTDPKSPFFDPLFASKIDRTAIDRDCAIRWVRRHWARGSATIALQVARDLRQSSDDLFRWDSVQDPLYKADLLTALGEVMVQKAEPIKDAADVLNQAIALLNEQDIASLNDVRQWHYDRIIGSAYNRLGYLYRTTGHYGLALHNYQFALKHFDRAKIESELATTLTNMAFLLAIVSRPKEALRPITRALNMRKDGPRYPYALTLNTEGIIHTLNDHPDTGVEKCREALRILRRIDDPRGIGLALNGLGFSLRKQANEWKSGVISTQQAQQIFDEGRQILEEAVAIFSHRYSEPIRLWEAHNELGSLYCDWGWLIRQSSRGYQDALTIYASSIDEQQTAVGVAKENDLQAQFLDSLDDLAQVYGDCSTLYAQIGRLEEAQKSRKDAEACLDDVVRAIDQEYILTPGVGFPIDRGHTVFEGEMQWLAMGKQHLWRGIWAFRDLAYRDVDDTVREEQLRTTFTNLFLSSIYFRRYWPISFDYERVVGYLTEFLPEADIRLDWALELLEDIEQTYDIQSLELRDLATRTLLY